MTKDIYITMDGLQFAGEESPGKVETVNVGEYYFKNGKHYVLFDELLEGTSVVTKNMIKFDEKSCSVNKKGAINVNMLFEEGKSILTNYGTMYGAIVIGIDTHSIVVSKEEDKIEVFIEYALAANYEHLANCKLHMTVNSTKK